MATPPQKSSTAMIGCTSFFRANRTIAIICKDQRDTEAN